MLDVEKFFVVRGILEPVSGDELSQPKEREMHQFVTKSSQFAGEDFEINQKELEALNEQLEEMDKINFFDFDPAKIKIEETLI